MKSQQSVIPTKLKDELGRDPFYKVCALSVIPGHICQGEITWEHALIHGGQKVQQKFAIVPICEGAHNVGIYQDKHTMKKELHVWIALARATEQDLKDMCGEGMYKEIGKFQKTYPWLDAKARLEAKYGPYNEEKAIAEYKPAPKEGRVSQSRLTLPVDIHPSRIKKVRKVMDFLGAEYNRTYSPTEAVEVMIDAFYDALFNRK